MGKHVMLSYQWNIQELVEKVYNGLRAMGLNAWMDIHGGVQGNINDSMAQGVDGAAVVCCFMTPEYQESKNCKKELSYADAQDVTIIPIMSCKGFKATGWLGIITAGLLWIDFRDSTKISTSLESLVKEIMHACTSENEIKIKPAELPRDISNVAPKRDTLVEKKPGRAFKHLKTGKYLAESGEVKFHQASGNRSTLVLRNNAEETSYWIEEKENKKSQIIYYKNFATNGYLGYDPNGDYIYTKAQHYGAEEWLLKADEQSSDGRRAVVIFANYGKKYLAICNGKLTGVSVKSEDCVWILD